MPLFFASKEKKYPSITIDIWTLFPIKYVQNMETPVGWKNSAVLAVLLFHTARNTKKTIFAEN